MPTIHNPTVTRYSLPRCGEGKRVLAPGATLTLSQKHVEELLAYEAWKARLEKRGDGKYAVREHRGVAGTFDQQIRAYRRGKARAEAEQRRASEDVETLKRRLEALESQATADKPKASVESVDDDTSKPSARPSSSSSGGGGKKQS